MGKREEIVLIGGGRHARVTIDLIESIGCYEIVGIVDPALKGIKKVFNVDVLGDDSKLDALSKKGVKRAALGIGSWGDNSLKGGVYKKVRALDFTFPALVHSHAYVSKYSQLSQGVQVMAGSYIQPGAVIGENSVINTGVIVEHDCQIGRNVFIGPRSVLCGGVKVGDSTFIGSGVCIIPEISIGTKCFVAAGSVVVKDARDKQKVIGDPLIRRDKKL